MSLAKIAKRTGISTDYASRLARDYKILVRGQKDYRVHQHPVLTRDWLNDQRGMRGAGFQGRFTGWPCRCSSRSLRVVRSSSSRCVPTCSAHSASMVAATASMRS